MSFSSVTSDTARVAPTSRRMVMAREMDDHWGGSSRRGRISPGWPIEHFYNSNLPVRHNVNPISGVQINPNINEPECADTVLQEGRAEFRVANTAWRMRTLKNNNEILSSKNQSHWQKMINARVRHARTCLWCRVGSRRHCELVQLCLVAVARSLCWPKLPLNCSYGSIRHTCTQMNNAYRVKKYLLIKS